MNDWWVNRPVQEPDHHCPACGCENHATMAVRNFETSDPLLPKEGDLSVCVSCLTIAVWQENNTLRMATSEECQEVPDFVRYQIAMAYHGTIS